MVDRGFGSFRASQIVALTLADNVGSWRLMEKLGITRREDLDLPDPAGGETNTQHAITRDHCEART